MNTNTEHADDTKLYAGGGKESPHARANEAGHDHEGPHMDLQPMPGSVVAYFAIGMVILLGLLLVLGLLPRMHRRGLAEAHVEENGNAKPMVGIAYPKVPTKKNTLEVPGDAQAFQVTSIYPRTSGYLKKRYVDIGDRVKEGQLLAEIDAPEIEAQLAAAQASLQQANAAQAKARDDYNLAEATYQRYEGFAKTGGVTTQQLDERRAALTSAKAALAGADANVKAAEAEVQRLSALVGFAKIMAPFDGTITIRGYDVGALLTANNSSGRELFQITQTDVLRVFVDIPQSYATLIQVGQPVKFTVRNYPGKLFDGSIARVSGAINQQSRTMRVEADFPNKDGALYPGMFGTLRYESEPEKNQLTIPSSALMFGPEGLRIATVDESNKIKFRNVNVEIDLGTEVQLAGGVTPSDRVVANPGERLVDGLEVNVGEQGEKKAAQAVAGSTGGEQGRRTQTAEADAK